MGGWSHKSVQGCCSLDPKSGEDYKLIPFRGRVLIKSKLLRVLHRTFGNTKNRSSIIEHILRSLRFGNPYLQRFAFKDVLELTPRQERRIKFKFIEPDDF